MNEDSNFSTYSPTLVIIDLFSLESFTFKTIKRKHDLHEKIKVADKFCELFIKSQQMPFTSLFL